MLQLPGKNQEGIQALVSLLAPDTRVQVSPYCLRPVEVSKPLGFYGDDDFLLDGNTPLGEGPFWLGMNGVLGAEEGEPADDIPQTFTTELGYYTGLQPAPPQQGNRRVTYKFN